MLYKKSDKIVVMTVWAIAVKPGRDKSNWAFAGKLDWRAGTGENLISGHAFFHQVEGHFCSFAEKHGKQFETFNYIAKHGRSISQNLNLWSTQLKNYFEAYKFVT